MTPDRPLSRLYARILVLKPIVERVVGGPKPQFDHRWGGFFLNGPDLTAPGIDFNTKLDHKSAGTMSIFLEKGGRYVPSAEIAEDPQTARSRVFRLKEKLPGGQIDHERGFGWKLNPAVKPS